jgi:hypothetical protein
MDFLDVEGAETGSAAAVDDISLESRWRFRTGTNRGICRSPWWVFLLGIWWGDHLSSNV